MKICDCCGRNLDEGMFLAQSTSIDKLSKKCRVCKSWRGPGKPTPEEAEQFYLDLIEVLKNAARAVPLYRRDRAQFENFVHKEFVKANLDQKWKLPVWVNEQTILE